MLILFGFTWAFRKPIYEMYQNYFVKKVDINGKEYLDKDYQIETGYKNYFYLLALDEKIYEMYKYNKEYLKKYNSKLKHRDLIFDYVEAVLKVKKTMEYDEEMLDDFLGPKGPGR